MKRRTVKDLSITFDVFINEGGVGAALFFVLVELIIVNTQNLYYVFGIGSSLNVILALIGAIGYSLVTTVVIRKNVNIRLKIMFPLFDVFLIFIGMNIKVFDNIFDNPLRFAVTVFFSLFTGAIILALGLINYKEHESDADALRKEFELVSASQNYYKSMFEDIEEKNKLMFESNVNIETKLEAVESAYMKMKSNLELTKTDNEKLKSENSSLKSKFEQTESEFKRVNGIMDGYKKHFFITEKSRILKKKPDNRTADEVEILRHAESYT